MPSVLSQVLMHSLQMLGTCVQVRGIAGKVIRERLWRQTAQSRCSCLLLREEIAEDRRARTREKMEGVVDGGALRLIADVRVVDRT
jgi:hypothetical protein